jgi:TP901 family phage tail tape measure protein
VVYLANYKIDVKAQLNQKSLKDIKTQIENLNVTIGRVSTKKINPFDSLNTSGKALISTNKKVGQSFADIFSKVAKFGSVASILLLVTRGINEAWNETKELNSSLISLQKVTDLGGESLRRYKEQAYDLAEQLSTSAKNVTDATTEFAKSGYDVQESMNLAETALVFQTIADEAISASDSANLLISIMQAYNLEQSKSIDIISKINEVSNNYSITSGQLSNSLGKVASVAKLANVSFDELLGLMTAGTTVTRNASKTANALRSIFINLQQVSKDGNLPKLEAQFNKFGKSLLDSTGNMKGAYETLGELSEVSKKLNTVSEKNAFRTLLEDIGGKYNINTLVAILDKFDIAVDATSTSLNDFAGSAQREFETASQSIEKRLELLKGQFQELVTGGGVEDFEKGIISLSTFILKLINDAGGLNTILVALVGTLITLKGTTILGAIVSGFTNFKLTLDTLVLSTKIAKAEQISLSTVLWGTNASAKALTLTMGALSIAITAGIAIFNLYSKKQQEAKQQTLDLASAQKQQLETLSSIKNTINSETTSRQDLLTALKNLNGDYDTEANKLKDINDLRKEGIELLDKETKKTAEQTIKESGTQYQSSKEFLTSPVFDREGGKQAGSPEEFIKQQEEIVDRFNQRIQAGEKLNWVETQLWKNAETNAKYYKAELEDAQTIVESYETAESILNGTYEQQKIDVDNLVDAQQNQISSYEDIEKALSGLNSQLDDIQSLYSTVSQAQDEYNQHQAISLDTYQKLMSIGDEYLGLLFNEDGSLKDLKTALQDVTVARINEISMKKAESLIDTVSTMSEEEQQAWLNVDANNALTDSLWNLINAEDRLAGIQGGVKNQVKNVIDGIDKWRQQAISGVTVTNNFSRAMTGFSSATKNAGKSLKQLAQDAKGDVDDLLDMTIKMLKQDYKDADKAFEKSINKQIDSLENLRDEELKNSKQRSEITKQQINADAENAKKSVENKKAQIQAEIDLLDAEKERRNYQKELSSSVKKSSSLEAQVLELQASDRPEDIAKRRQLEEQLQSEKENQDNLQYDNRISLNKKLLQQQLSDYQKEIELINANAQLRLENISAIEQSNTESINRQYDSQISALNNELEKRKENAKTDAQVRQEAIQLVQNKSDDLYKRLMDWNKTYGDGLSSTLESAWESGYKALEKYEYKQLGVLEVLEKLNRTILNATDNANNLTGVLNNSNVGKVSSNSVNAKMTSRTNSNIGREAKYPMTYEQSKTMYNNPNINININGNADTPLVRRLERSSTNIANEVVKKFNKMSRQSGRQSNAKYSMI